MRLIKGARFDEERALYGIKETKITESVCQINI